MASSTLPRSKLHQEIQKMCEGLKKIFKALIQYAVEQASSEGEHTHLNEVHTCFLEVLPLILNDFEAESMADMMCQKYGNQELPVNQEKMEWAISFMYEMRQEIERLLDKFILYDHLRSQEKMLLEDSKNVQDPKSPPAYSETDQKAHQASSETDPKCPQTSSGTESKIDLLEDFVRVLKVIIQYLVDLCTSYEREAHVTETLLSLVRDIKAKRITKQVASQSCGSQELPVNTEKTEGGISIIEEKEVMQKECQRSVYKILYKVKYVASGKASEGEVIIEIPLNIAGDNRIMNLVVESIDLKNEEVAEVLSKFMCIAHQEMEKGASDKITLQDNLISQEKIVSEDNKKRLYPKSLQVPSEADPESLQASSEADPESLQSSSETDMKSLQASSVIDTESPKVSAASGFSSYKESPHTQHLMFSFYFIESRMKLLTAKKMTDSKGFQASSETDTKCLRASSEAESENPQASLETDPKSPQASLESDSSLYEVSPNAMRLMFGSYSVESRLKLPPASPYRMTDSISLGSFDLSTSDIERSPVNKMTDSKTLQTSSETDSTSPQAFSEIDTKNSQASLETDPKWPQSSSETEPKRSQVSSETDSKSPQASSRTNMKSLKTSLETDPKWPQASTETESKRNQVSSETDKQSPQSSSEIDSKSPQASSETDAKSPRASSEMDPKSPQTSSETDTKCPQAPSETDTESPQAASETDAKSPRASLEMDPKSPKASSEKDPKSPQALRETDSNSLQASSEADSKSPHESLESDFSLYEVSPNAMRYMFGSHSAESGIKFPPASPNKVPKSLESIILESFDLGVSHAERSSVDKMTEEESPAVADDQPIEEGGIATP